MSKLTLSVDEKVVENAKLYAREHGVSVSSLVENYLKAIGSPHAPDADPPILRALRGKLKPADPDEYLEHLAEKYK